MTADSDRAPSAGAQKTTPAEESPDGFRPGYMARTKPTRIPPDPFDSDQSPDDERPEYMVRTKPTRTWPDARDTYRD